MSLASLLQELPPAHRKHLEPSSPAGMRVMAAKGLIPIPPREMVLVLCGFYYETDSRLSTFAREALLKLPDRILSPTLGTDLPPAALYVLALVLTGREELLEKVFLNRKTPDSVLVELAPICSARLLELLAGNQERCLRSKELISGIRQNPKLGNAQRDRLFDFLARCGQCYPDMPEFRDAYQRIGQPYPGTDESSEDTASLSVAADASLDTGDFLPSGYLEDESVEDSPRVPIQQLVATLTVGQKVSLASKGNQEARKILIRDRNKAVAAAALSNPRITEREILTAAQSKAMSEEVIRLIAENPEYMSVYAIKQALVNNPKTPLGIAMRLLPYLRQPDIKSISTSRGIPSALVNQAKRLLKRRR